MALEGPAGMWAAHISPRQPATGQLKAPPWPTLGRDCSCSDACHAFLPAPVLSSPALHPHPRPQPSPAGAVLGEQSPWGQLPALLFRGQAEAPGQSWAHTRVVAQQLSGRGRLRLHLDHPPFPPPACSLTGESGHGAHTHLPSRAVTAKLAGLLHAEGARLQVRAQARARGRTGAEHLARWALCGERRE